MKRVIGYLLVGLVIGLGVAYYSYFKLYKTTEYIRVEYSPPFLVNDTALYFKASYVEYANDSVAYNTEHTKAKYAYGYISRHMKRLRPANKTKEGIRLYKEQAVFLNNFLDMNIVLLKIKHNQDFNSNELLREFYHCIQYKDVDRWNKYLNDNEIKVNAMDVWHTLNTIPFN